MPNPFVGANAPKTGRGRSTGAARRVPDVESVACAGRSDGPHKLYNDHAGVTRCWFCAEPWAELDAEVRA